MKIPMGKLFADDGLTQVGEHFFDADVNRIVPHPLKDGVTINSQEYLIILAGNPELRERAGWHNTAKTHHDAEPLTYWQHIVNHTATPEGVPALKTALAKEIKANE